MAVRINTPQKINGVDYPAGLLAVGLSSREEDQLAGGGGADRVNLPPVSGAVSSVLPIYPVGAPLKEMPILAAYDFAGIITAPDTTNVTYTQVADKLRADGSGRAIKIAATANGVYGRIRFNKGKDIAQNASRKFSTKVYVDPTIWNYGAGRTPPNMNFLVSPNNVTSAQTNAAKLALLNNAMMPGVNFISQRFDVGAVGAGAGGGYAEWTEQAGGDVAAYASGASVARYSFADVTLATSGDYVQVENLSIGERGVPVKMFGFDDASLVDNQYNLEALQYLIDRGIKAYIATRGSYVTPARYATMDRLFAAGFDHIFQGWTNTNWSTATGTYPTLASVLAAFRAEWQQCIDFATQRGWLSRVKAMASYAQNGFVNELNDVLFNEFGMKSVRVARAAAVNGTPGGKAITPFFNARDIGGPGWSYAGNGAAWSQATLDSGHTLMTYTHGMVAAGATPSATETKIDEFKKLVDFWVDARDQGKALILSPTEHRAYFPLSA